jgi:general L-amino acid transport system substrate-binding protein
MINLKKITTAVMGSAFALGLAQATPAFADTLDDVKERGFLRCGTSEFKAGFAIPESDGWEGIEIDFCKAITAAIFGDDSKNEVVPVTSKVRFTALTAREIDVLLKGTTWTYSRDAKLGVDFAAYFFFDGQGFLVSKALGVTSAKELDGATICVSPGTTGEKNIADFFKVNGMEYTPVIIRSGPESLAALQEGRCDVITNDISSVASSRLKFANPDDFVVLNDNIAKEPLSIYTRQNESRWNDIVKWTRNALVEAEELGITQANADDMLANNNDPRVQRLLGATGEFGAMLGLPNDFALNAIKAVGNYGEVFERNVGSGSKVGLSRELNRQWSEGGLMFSPPFR